MSLAQLEWSEFYQWRTKMTNEILENIKQYATKLLMTKYGYCGVADDNDFALLNSDDGNGKDIKITIEIKDED